MNRSSLRTSVPAALAWLFLSASLVCHADAPAPPDFQPVVIKAGQLIDGKGHVQRGVSLLIEGTQIRCIDDATPAGARPTYDFSRLTVLPGLIDTHVHLDSHFGKNGRVVLPRTSATSDATFFRPMALFQSMRPSVDERDAFCRGTLRRQICFNPRARQ